MESDASYATETRLSGAAASYRVWALTLHATDAIVTSLMPWSVRDAVDAALARGAALGMASTQGKG